jgi:hypothetical protein
VQQPVLSSLSHLKLKQLLLCPRDLIGSSSGGPLVI